MTEADFRERTKSFALGIIKLVEGLPRSVSGDVMRRQLVRAGTSVGANYRAACRARSRAEFVAKMGIVEEECDEAMYWLALLVDSGVVREERILALLQEGDELLSMTVASILTARGRKRGVRG